MEEKPSEFPEWAQIDRLNPVTGQNNVLPPPDEKRLLGFNFKEQPPRQWFNWLFRTINQWLKFFDQEIAAQKESSDLIADKVQQHEDQLQVIAPIIVEHSDKLIELEQQIADLPAGGGGGVIGGGDGVNIEQKIVRSNGTGSLKIEDEYCSFTLSITGNRNCGLDPFLYAVGYRGASYSAPVVYTLKENGVVSIGAISSDGTIETAGHIGSHYSMIATIIKESPAS